MSFWRIAAKMSPSKSCTRSGMRGVKGGQSRSGRPARVSSARSAMPMRPGISITSPAPTPSACTIGAAQVGGRVGGHGELDHLAAAAALQRGLELAHEVLGLLLDLEVAVAQHAEGAVAEHDVAGEELAEEDLEQRLERQEAGLALGPVGQADEARNLAGDRQQRLEHGVVGVAPELQAHGEAAVGDEGEGVRRVDGERREDREDLVEEVALHELEVGALEVGGAEDLDALVAHELAQDAEAFLLAHHQRAGVGVDAAELVGGGEAVGARDVHAGAHQAAQAGDADGVELVEVRGGDREEAHPLEQRHGRVLGLGHHPPVEGEPGELAVDEALGAGDVEAGQAAAGRGDGVQEVGVDLALRDFDRLLDVDLLEHSVPPRMRARPWGIFVASL